MNLTDALKLLEKYYPERFYNAIVNIFDVVLESAPMRTPHALPQLELNISLNIDSSIKPLVHTP